MESDASFGSSSSSSSDSVLIRVPLDQKRRKKLRAQLQEDQRRHGERQSFLAASCSPDAHTRPQSFSTDLLESHDRSKSEHICVVCEQEGGDLVVCLGPCISAFHVRCLPPDSGAAEAHDEAWLCPNCKSKTHACFHCKRVGVEMLADDVRATTHSESLKRPVRKCRALSCGKFYHQECISLFPLARIAINTHFICPLHTCAGCNQSGAQQEAVRCMRCPVAYHARCLPRNCVRRISTKLIICPKHAGAEKEGTGGDDGVGGGESKQSVKNAASKHVSRERAGNEDEVVSEASVVSASSARRKEKREKREKRDKKKKKKKKKKDKHKERKESVAAQGNDALYYRNGERGGKKRKRSKRDILESDGKTVIQRVDKGSVPTSFGRRVDHTAAAQSAGSTVAWASRSSMPSLALSESPATVNRRIQKRLEEALGHSDDDDSDISISDPSPKTKPSGSDVHGVNLDTSVVLKKEESSNGGRPLSLGESEVKETATSSSSSVPMDVHPSGDRGSLAAKSSTEEGTADLKGNRDKHWQKDYDVDATTARAMKRGQLVPAEDGLKHESQKSPSASVLIPSSTSVAPAGLVLKHVPSEDEYEDDDGGVGPATPPANATPRTSRAYVYGKKKRKNKVKREAQRVLKREASEEDDDEGDEAKWVQCDSCKKWRTVPRNFDLDAMPKHWYCNMNTWDQRFASCVVAEEVVKVGSSPRAGKRRYRLKNSKSSGSNTGDVGGYSSSGSGAYKRSGGPMRSSAADLTVQDEKDKTSRSKNKDKATKKRKITKQLKEKYREVKWVQCENSQCGKWRIVPASIDFDRLPAVWYCHLNTWAPELAKCSVPNPAEVNVFLLKQAKKDDRPPKKTRASVSMGDPAPVVPVPATSGGGATPTSPVNDLTNACKPNVTKYGKGLKSMASWTRNTALLVDSNTTDEACNGSNNNVDGATSGQTTKGRGGRGHNNSGNGHSAGMKKTVLEWAQCEKCNKWRKLPQHIKSSTLPDKWYCSMNHWDPTHAKCSVPEEADQEPLSLPPHPGSQWHKGGHKGQRSRRGKLSYSELLYGSTGQLRKAYTTESSTLSFEYEGMTYHRDGQYKRSSMYVSPAAMAAAATMAGWGGSDHADRATTSSYDVTGGSESRSDTVSAVTPQLSVDRVAALVLESMDLRQRRSVLELFDVVNSALDRPKAASTGLASLAIVTAALGQLEHRGLVEKVTEPPENGEENEPSRMRVRVEMLFNGAFCLPTHYRKVPTRPLKASKCWKYGTNMVAVSPVKDA